MNILVTGGAGFIGSNFIHYFRQTYPDSVLFNVDKLTYAGNLNNLRGLAVPHYYFFQIDICDQARLEAEVFSKHQIDVVVHFAAESHVDRSILGNREFVQTNVLGTQSLLEASRQAGVKRFVHVSTDEVYGELGETGYFTEQTPLHPNSPYSASKAGSDLIALAYAHTYGMDVVVTRCSNNYGPYQFPEKLIPLMVTKALHDQPLPVYGTGKNVRDWIYVEDHCRGVDMALRKGKTGEVYNFGGDSERNNLDMVKAILSHLNKPSSLITFVADRLGHDFRYAIDFSKATRELGWTPSVTVEEGLAKTIQWYVDHPAWWQPLLRKDS